MTKSILILAIAIAFLIGTLTIQTTSNISAQEDSIPSWIKNTAGFWADSQISDMEFMNAIEFLIGQEIIQVPEATAQKETVSIFGKKFYVVKEEIEPKSANKYSFYDITIPDKELDIKLDVLKEFDIMCDEGDVALSSGYRTIGDLKVSVSEPIQSSTELTYYDGWKFAFTSTKFLGSTGATMYVYCADTNF